MHLTVEQILWAFVVAGHLILLIVLLGRERVSRFPWFTGAIVLSTIRLIADHLLHGKLTTLAFYWQSYSTMTVDAILGLVVLIELLRFVFSSGKAGLILNAKGWLGWTLVTCGVAVAAVWAWGPWPTWLAINSDPAQRPLLIVVLLGMKGQLLTALLTVQVALLMRIFGRRFGFGWRTHPQQIALGLSTNALGLLVNQVITDLIKRNLHLTSRDEYERVVKLFTNFDNARSALWVLVLVWWIVWLWRDEPGYPVATLFSVQAIPVDGADVSSTYPYEEQSPIESPHQN